MSTPLPAGESAPSAWQRRRIALRYGLELVAVGFTFAYAMDVLLRRALAWTDHEIVGACFLLFGILALLTIARHGPSRVEERRLDLPTYDARVRRAYRMAYLRALPLGGAAIVLGTVIQRWWPS